LVLKDLNCTQESPETCPPTTLCCLNKCYGAVNDEENTFSLPSFHCPGQLYCQKTDTCHDLSVFDRKCPSYEKVSPSITYYHSARLFPQGCQENSSRISILDNLPNSLNYKIDRNQCFNLTGIGNDCELEIKGNYTRNSESEICLNFANTWGRSNDLFLKCRKQCMTQHRITIVQNGNSYNMLLAFGMDLPILGFDNDQQKLVIINEKEQYPVQKLFNIGDNLRVKLFLLQGKGISDFFFFRLHLLIWVFSPYFYDWK